MHCKRGFRVSSPIHLAVAWMVIALIHPWLVHGQRREGAGQIREVVHGGTAAKFGPADEAFLRDLEAQITFDVNDDDGITSGVRPEGDSLFSSLASLRAYTLLPLKKGICPCAVSVFSHADDELRCNEICAQNNLARCGCDFLDQSHPMRYLCYQQHCVEESKYFSPAAPIATVALVSLAVAIIILFFAAALSNSNVLVLK